MKALKEEKQKYISLNCPLETRGQVVPIGQPVELTRQQVINLKASGIKLELYNEADKESN